MRYGLIAGSGRFPEPALESARRLGRVGEVRRFMATDEHR
jgi:hypothetical protein